MRYLFESTGWCVCVENQLLLLIDVISTYIELQERENCQSAVISCAGYS
jgi:hypothetical protein